MVDRSQVQIDSLETAEGALDAGETLILTSGDLQMW
jgi:hypothetical protein